VTPLDNQKTRIFYSQIFGDAADTNILSKYLFNPNTVRNYMFLHQFMEGDILLSTTRQQQQQPNNNEESPLLLSSDVFGHTYRYAYWNKVKEVSQKKLPSLFLPSKTTVNNRRLLLDRYKSHTLGCKVCNKAQLKSKRLYHGLGQLRTKCIAMIGASQFLSIITKSFFSHHKNQLLLANGATIQSTLMVSTALLTLTTFVVSYWRRLLQQNIQKFAFEERRE